MLPINPAIFKAYDIRGVYPTELDETTATQIGKALAVFSKATTALIGKDARLSSEPLFHALVQGLREQGVNVIDIGICSTPIFYFACNHFKTDIGVMITASHNPPEYNGFKICRNGTVPVSGPAGLFKVRDLALASEFKPVLKKGTLKQKNILADYEQFFLQKNPQSFRVKTIVDTANSVGVFETRVLEKRCTVLPLFFELDGTFPNHLGNPLDYATMKPLQEKVVLEKANLGIALDGDADRVGFVDEKGSVVPSDIITSLLARFFPHETVLFDVRSTKQIETSIRQAGGKPLRCPVGHTLIKEQMRKAHAAFAGELSGHYYYRDLFFAESPLQTMFLLLLLLEHEQKPLSELVAQTHGLFQSGEINFKVVDTTKTIRRIEQHFAGQTNLTTSLDGLTMDFGNWWFNLRASNTEPLLRLNLEADSRNVLEENVKVISSLCGEPQAEKH